MFGSSFLDDLCKSWSQINYKDHGEVMSKDVINKQIIWLNSKICSNKIPLKCRALATKGLILVKDLFNADGVLKDVVVMLAREYDTC